MDVHREPRLQEGFEMDEKELNSRRYLSHQLIYENEWIDYGFRQLPIIKEFRRFDPGMNSDLLRDEQLIAEIPEYDPSLEVSFGSKNEARIVGRRSGNFLEI